MIKEENYLAEKNIIIVIVINFVCFEKEGNYPKEYSV